MSSKINVKDNKLKYIFTLLNELKQKSKEIFPLFLRLNLFDFVDLVKAFDYTLQQRHLTAVSSGIVIDFKSIKS